MTFSVTANPTTQELSEAVNYLLANFSQTMAINPNTGSITTANYGVVSYLYKYLQVRYADSYDGSVNFSNVPTNRLYYGIRNNDSDTESTNPSDYLWLPVTGGFGTTKFVWYNTTGGRQIEIFIGPVRPSVNFVKDNGNAIDLDLLTTAAEDKTDPPAVDYSLQIQALEQAIGSIPQPQLGTLAPQNAENVAITGGSINGTSIGSTTASTGHFTSISLDSPLAIGYGGTNGTATPTAGSVAYGTGSAYGFTSAGTVGQYLQSTGTTAPTWSSISSGVGSPAYYGLLVSTTNQTNGGSTTANIVALDSSPLLSNGVSVVSGNKITFANAGQYEVIVELAFTNSTGSNPTIQGWLSQNGTNIANSTQDVQFTGGSGNVVLLVTSWIVNVSAGDYIQAYWSCSATTVSLAYQAAGTSPTRPASPSASAVVFSLSQIGIGYYGVTSSTSITIATGSKTFTTNISATSTAFTVGTRVRFAYTTTPANFMEGVITSFSGTTMVVNVDLTGGSGTYAAWSLSVAGNQGTGAVTSVTATAPVASTGGSTPVISMAAATSSVNGYLTSTDWTTFNGKQPAGTYVNSVSGTAPIVSSGGVTPAISIPAATTSVSGYLTSTDWTTFNNKGSGTVTSVTGTAPVVSSGGTTPAISMAAANTTTNGYLTSTDWNTFNGKGSGSVTSVSVVSANGFAGTVATATTTPAITLTTSITGLLKGNGTAISAAVANTDYVPLSTVLTKTADYTITGTDTWIINNKTGSALTLTFPAASAWTGRSITVKNMQAQLVNSASSNIVPIDSTTAGTAILLGVIGNWATMVSDGTNWVIMQAASNNNLLLE